MHVGIIGGASTIGATLAYSVACEAATNSVTLLEKATDAAWAHATDITHARYHTCNSPVPSNENSEPGIGAITHAATEEIAEFDLDAIVITARSPPTDDDEKRSTQGSRTRELRSNVPLIDSIAAEMSDLRPLPVIVVTNPVDRITYRLWRQLGWPRSNFIGFSLAETARVADAIAKRRGVHPTDVSCPTMGEHGEHVVPLFSRATIGDEPVTIPKTEREAIVEDVQEIPFTIAQKRGLQDSSRWVTSAGLLRVLRTLFDENLTDPLCLSVPLDDEYGFDDGCLSIPVTLTHTGVDRTIEWTISDEEMRRLREAHDAIREDIRTLDR